MNGTYFLEELAKLRDEFEIVGDVRGKGLMIGVELVTDKVLLDICAGHEKTCLWGFRLGHTQIGLYNHRRWLEA